MTCPSCYNQSCPENVATVTINQNILQLSTGDAEVTVEAFAAVSGLTVTLSGTPITGYAVKVWVNGVLQQETTHYSVSGTTVTFTFSLNADDVQVEYAYEV